MDNTIIINSEGFFKSDDYSTTIIKTRIWPAIISSLRWIFNKTITGNILVQDGLGFMLITNLAMVVEGFIADIIVQELQANHKFSIEQLEQLEDTSWEKKKKKYFKVFNNKIEDYQGYKAVEILFELRNTIAHGRSHREISTRHYNTDQKTMVKSIESKYEKARKFFIQVGLMKDSENTSNIENVWKIKNGLYLMTYARLFMENVLKNHSNDHYNGIDLEFRNAWDTSIK